MTDLKPSNLPIEATKKLALTALADLKAAQVELLDVRNVASFTDYMIFASGSSRRHVSAIAESVVEAAEAVGQPPVGVEGEDVGEWVLIDLGDDACLKNRHQYLRLNNCCVLRQVVD